MSAEIERKYTVKDQSYRQESIECKYYKQGYISIDKERTVRIRISGNNAFITLKGVTTGCTRKEFECCRNARITLSSFNHRKEKVHLSLCRTQMGNRRIHGQ